MLTVNISNNTEERFLVSIGREKDSGDSIKDLLSCYTGMNTYDMRIELDRKEVEGYLNKASHITDGNMILRENDSVEYIFYMMYPQSKEKYERLDFQWRPEYDCEEINLPIQDKEKLTECFMKYIYLCPESEIIKYYFDKSSITLNGSALIPYYDEQRSYV